MEQPLRKNVVEGRWRDGDGSPKAGLPLKRITDEAARARPPTIQCTHASSEEVVQGQKDHTRLRELGSGKGASKLKAVPSTAALKKVKPAAKVAAKKARAPARA